MKKITVLAAFVLGICLTTLFSFKNNSESEDKKALGKVLVIDGKFVFTNSEPVAPYETAFQFKTKVGSFGGCPSSLDVAKAVVESAKKNGLPFDAVIVGSEKYDLAIKYK